MRGTSLTLCAVLLIAVSGCSDSNDDGATDAGGGGAGGMAGSGGMGGGAGGMAGSGGMGGGGDTSCMDDEGCSAGARCDLVEHICRTACDSDDQCGARGVCTEGLCHTLKRCAEEDSCAAGTVCNCDHICEPADGNPCQGNLQCPVDGYCDLCSHTCKTKVQPCGRCSDVTACERGGDLCRPIGPAGLDHCLRPCDEPGGCNGLGPGYECADLGDGTMACVPRSGDCAMAGDCEADGECEVGSFCNERLYCQPGCLDDTGCPNGTVCQGLRCEPPCENDGQCGDGGVCDQGGHCRVPGGCLTSVDCLEPETYCDTEMRMCVPGCERNEDCLDATQECIASTCVERGCAGNYQCAFGEVCALEAGDCVEAEGRHCEADCDPMDEMSCGDTGQRCLSLQDEDENPLGDFCFEPCQPAPNECPQGYGCTELTDQDGTVVAELCFRRCDLDPFR